MPKRFTYFLVIAVLGISCEKSEVETYLSGESILHIPEHFPEPEFPADNPFSEPAWKLGKLLFFDNRLSKDEKVSCASCHLPGNAFSDTVSFSLGFGGLSGTRNAPSLANVAYHPYYTREGGIPTLEMQVLVPVQEHNEFNNNILEIAERLASDTDYQELALQAYERELDYYVIPRAIATFERSLISGNSKYDRFVNGKTGLNDLELQGWSLFNSEDLNCTACHSGFNFSSYEFANNGLYHEYTDPGRFRLTGNDTDLAMFKIPSLRNVEVTGPYMHDGSYRTLEEVIEHYNSGGKSHPHKSPLIRPLGLSEHEILALVAFLKTLTDKTFINNEKFRN